jgi:hypothetical protein
MKDEGWKMEDDGWTMSDEGRIEMRMNAVCYLYL